MTKLPKDWPEDWPKSKKELIEAMKTKGFLEYCEDRGIFIRFDDKNDRIIVTKKESFEP